VLTNGTLHDIGVLTNGTLHDIGVLTNGTLHDIGVLTDDISTISHYHELLLIIMRKIS